MHPLVIEPEVTIFGRGDGEAGLPLSSVNKPHRYHISVPSNRLVKYSNLLKD